VDGWIESKVETGRQTVGQTDKQRQIDRHLFVIRDRRMKDRQAKGQTDEVIYRNRHTHGQISYGEDSRLTETNNDRKS